MQFSWRDLPTHNEVLDKLHELQTQADSVGYIRWSAASSNSNVSVQVTDVSVHGGPSRYQVARWKRPLKKQFTGNEVKQHRLQCSPIMSLNML